MTGDNFVIVIITLVGKETHLQNFQEILNFTIFCVYARNYTLEIWHAFDEISEISFICWVVHEVLNRIEPTNKTRLDESSNISQYRAHLALIALTSRKGMHNQILKRRLPVGRIGEVRAVNNIDNYQKVLCISQES